jgi:hypothetical protein
MATCRFPGCDAADGSEALPPGWTLVLFETRKPGDDLLLEIDRRRMLLCPEHAVYVARLCGLLPGLPCADAPDRAYRARD